MSALRNERLGVRALTITAASAALFFAGCEQESQNHPTAKPSITPHASSVAIMHCSPHPVELNPNEAVINHGSEQSDFTVKNLGSGSTMGAHYKAAVSIDYGNALRPLGIMDDNDYSPRTTLYLSSLVSGENALYEDHAGVKYEVRVQLAKQSAGAIAVRFCNNAVEAVPNSATT